MKKLPTLYTNTFNKKIDNSTEYIKVNNENDIKILTKDELNKKINNIFKSKNYIYKVKVEIILKDNILNTYLVGKIKDNLITIDNELININDINNIKEI